jgi:hypothetical protein
LIVSGQPTSIRCITQPDHAALAGRLMSHWAADGLSASPRRSDILLAVGAHDNGWREIDVAPFLDESSGQILDFVTLPAPMRRAVWPRVVGELLPTPYAAALVAEHALVAYRRLRADPEWTAFFEEMTELRDRHLQASGVDSLDQLRRDYAFVRLGDIASLTFCGVDMTELGEEFGYTLRLDGTRLLFSPDPFDGKTVALEVPFRELPAQVFASRADVRRAWEAAEVRTLSGKAVGASLH